jgi:hypothetical protein
MMREAHKELEIALTSPNSLFALLGREVELVITHDSTPCKRRVMASRSQRSRDHNPPV